jgi:N-acetylmuramoyl-L-alanine amidase
MHRVYISASDQEHNIGVGNYGSEAGRMHPFSDRVKYWLETQKGKFVVFRNSPGWSLKQTVNDCNNLACELFVENHTNAGRKEQTAGDGGAEGTEVFYWTQGGTKSKSYVLASSLYKHLAPLSPGKDRGIRPDSTYSGGSLYVIQETNPPASLVEHIFHTNYEEVEDFLARTDEYAKEEAKAICEYCEETWIEPAVKHYRMYRVVSGDTLWLIASELLGNGRRYPEIKSLNGLATDTLTPGQILKIPEE